MGAESQAEDIDLHLPPENTFVLPLHCFYFILPEVRSYTFILPLVIFSDNLFCHIAVRSI